MFSNRKKLNELKCFSEKSLNTNCETPYERNFSTLFRNETLFHYKSVQLKGLLEINELNITLKTMKIGKSPVADRFPADFFKVF